MEGFAPILTEEQIQHKVAKRAELPNQTANRIAALARCPRFAITQPARVQVATGGDASYS